MDSTLMENKSSFQKYGWQNRLDLWAWLHLCLIGILLAYTYASRTRRPKVVDEVHHQQPTRSCQDDAEFWEMEEMLEAQETQEEILERAVDETIEDLGRAYGDDGDGKETREDGPGRAASSGSSSNKRSLIYERVHKSLKQRFEWLQKRWELHHTMKLMQEIRNRQRERRSPDATAAGPDTPAETESSSSPSANPETARDPEPSPEECAILGALGANTVLGIILVLGLLPAQLCDATSAVSWQPTWWTFPLAWLLVYMSAFTFYVEGSCLAPGETLHKLMLPVAIVVWLNSIEWTIPKLTILGLPAVLVALGNAIEDLREAWRDRERRQKMWQELAAPNSASARQSQWADIESDRATHGS